jgi:hypothetical protein
MHNMLRAILKASLKKQYNQRGRVINRPLSAISAYLGTQYLYALN